MDVAFCVFVLLSIGTAHGSHMYGMHINWRPSPLNSSLVDVTMRQTFSSSPCNYVTYSTGSFLACNINTASCYSVSSNRTNYCKTNSVGKNWRTLVDEYTSALPSSKQFRIRYSLSCCWISGPAGFNSAQVYALVDLGIRSDTETPNHPPKVVYIPAHVFQHGCPDHIQLVASDPDGDRVACRIGNTSECGGRSCSQSSHFLMDESTCQLYYTGGGSPTYVSVWVFVEDFPQTSITLDGNRTFDPNTRLSYTPYQFNVQVLGSNYNCSSRPSFVNPTPAAFSGYFVSPSNPLNITIAVQSSTSGTFYVAGPSTMIQSPTNYSGGVATKSISYSLPNTTNYDDPNQYICYYFVTSTTGSTQQRCVQLGSTGSGINPCSTENGGCSDVCTWNGGSTVQCSCYRSCWILANDGKNCVPDVKVSCPSHSMNLTIPVCSIDGLVGVSNYSTSLAPSSCRHNISNGNYHFFFGANQCNTVVQELPLKIRLANTIKVWIESNSSSGSGLITRRGNFYNIPVSCYYSRFANITQVFGVQEQNTSIDALSVPGLGDFTFDFDYFKNVDFAHAFSPFEYPVPYELDSDVYFGIRSTSSVPNVRLFTKACWAVPYGLTDSSLVYQLISEGCPLDDTIKVFPSSDPIENLFSVKAFRFRYGLPGITSSTRIAIQCTIQICVTGLNTRCAQGCVSSSAGRKRREINGDGTDRNNKVDQNDDDDDDDDTPPSFSTFESPDHDVATTGPFIILIPDEDIANTAKTTTVKAEAKNDLNVIMIAVLAVGSALLLVALSVIGWFCHKRAYRAKKNAAGDFDEAK